jgi:hypothetical protein
MREIHRGAGAMMVLRSSLDLLVGDDSAEQDEALDKLWNEAGNWYGHYLSSKIGGKVLPFLEKDLKAGWNLDEVELSEDEEVVFRFTCFMMSGRFTELLLSFMLGVMGSLGYGEVETDRARGMATVRYAKIPQL